MTPEELEYFNKVYAKFNELKDAFEDQPASLRSSLADARNHISEVDEKLKNLKTGAYIGAGAGALTGACAGACIAGPLGALAGAIIGAISGGAIGAAFGYYLLDILSVMDKTQSAINKAFMAM